MGGCRLWKVARVGPAADTEDDLQVAVSLLQEVELFDAAVDVVARVVPGIGGIVLVSVRLLLVRCEAEMKRRVRECHPWVCQVHFSRLRPDVGERVKHMSELVGGNVLRLVISSVDGPVHEIGDAAVALMLSHCCRLLCRSL